MNIIKTNVETINGFDEGYLHIKYKENDNRYEIIIVYAPNDIKEKHCFLKNILKIL